MLTEELKTRLQQTFGGGGDELIKKAKQQIGENVIFIEFNDHVRVSSVSVAETEGRRHSLLDR